MANRLRSFIYMLECPAVQHPPSPQTPFWWSEFSIQGPGDQPARYSSIRFHYSLPTRGNLHFFCVDKHVSTFYPLTVPLWGCLAKGTVSLFHTEADINSRGTKQQQWQHWIDISNRKKGDRGNHWRRHLRRNYSTSTLDKGFISTQNDHRAPTCLMALCVWLRG